MPCTNYIDDDDWLRKTVGSCECESRHDDGKIGKRMSSVIVLRGLSNGACVYMMNIKKNESYIKTPV